MPIINILCDKNYGAKSENHSVKALKDASDKVCGIDNRNCVLETDWNTDDDGLN